MFFFQLFKPNLFKYKMLDELIQTSILISRMYPANPPSSRRMEECTHRQLVMTSIISFTRCGDFAGSEVRHGQLPPPHAQLSGPVDTATKCGDKIKGANSDQSVYRTPSFCLLPPHQFVMPQSSTCWVSQRPLTWLQIDGGAAYGLFFFVAGP
jgi:hypothetical protein